MIWIQTIGTLMVFLKEFFEKLILKKSADDKKSLQNYPVCKELNLPSFFSWKDQHNVFRKDPSLKLKCVPTLLRIGQVRAEI